MPGAAVGHFEPSHSAVGRTAVRVPPSERRVGPGRLPGLGRCHAIGAPLRTERLGVRYPATLIRIFQHWRPFRATRTPSHVKPTPLVRRRGHSEAVGKRRRRSVAGARSLSSRDVLAGRRGRPLFYGGHLRAFVKTHEWDSSFVELRRGALRTSVMILPQVHLRKPCYDFYFL